MPKGPRGKRRLADTVACAVMVAKIATGEIEDEKNGTMPGRRRSGIAGGKARAEKLSKERRAEIAGRAAAKRWS